MKRKTKHFNIKKLLIVLIAMLTVVLSLAFIISYKTNQQASEVQKPQHGTIDNQSRDFKEFKRKTKGLQSENSDVSTMVLSTNEINQLKQMVKKMNPNEQALAEKQLIHFQDERNILNQYENLLTQDKSAKKLNKSVTPGKVYAFNAEQVPVVEEIMFDNPDDKFASKMYEDMQELGTDADTISSSINSLIKNDGSIKQDNDGAIIYVSDNFWQSDYTAFDSNLNNLNYEWLSLSPLTSKKKLLNDLANKHQKTMQDVIDTQQKNAKEASQKEARDEMLRSSSVAKEASQKEAAEDASLEKESMRRSSADAERYKEEPSSSVDTSKVENKPDLTENLNPTPNRSDAASSSNNQDNQSSRSSSSSSSESSSN